MEKAFIKRFATSEEKIIENNLNEQVIKEEKVNLTKISNNLKEKWKFYFPKKLHPLIEKQFLKEIERIQSLEKKK